MNLKILFMLLIYWFAVGTFFYFGADHLNEYSNSVDFNSTGLSDAELDTGGNFVTGIDFGRFIGLVFFGVGLPASTPSWFSYLFIGWQSVITILSIGWFISSIWNG